MNAHAREPSFLTHIIGCDDTDERLKLEKSMARDWSGIGDLPGGVRGSFDALSQEIEPVAGPTPPVRHKTPGVALGRA
jgi:hypothetical protein